MASPESYGPKEVVENQKLSEEHLDELLLLNDPDYDAIPKKQRIECLNAVKQGLGVDVNNKDFKYLTDAYVVRFCVARKFEPEPALAMIEQHISWRQKIHFEITKPSDENCRQIFSSGYVMGGGVDVHGNQILWLDGSKFDKNWPLDGFEAAVAYLLHYTSENSSTGKATIFFDLENYSAFYQFAPYHTRSLVNICQNQFPERLGIAVLYKPQFGFQTVFKLAKALMDARTARKVNWGSSLEEISEFIPKDQIPTRYGGLKKKRINFLEEEEKEERRKTETILNKKKLNQNKIHSNTTNSDDKTSATMI